MAIRLISLPNQVELFNTLARELLRFLAECSGEHIPVALPGGRSVVGLLSPLLKALPELDESVRARLQFFMLDERRVPLDSPESNFKLLKENVFESALETGLFTNGQLHPYHYSRPVDEYYEELKQFGGMFAAAVLGVGEDAHVGALFPEHHSIRNSSPGYFIMEDSPKPPPQRMTISRSLLEQTQFGVALFIGEAKRTAFEKFQGGAPIEECPVGILRSFPSAIAATDLTL